MAFVDNSEHLGVDDLCRFLAERLAGSKLALAVQVRIVSRRQLYQSDSFAHAPARHRAPRQGGGLLDIAFGAGRFSAIDNFLSGAAAEHADDARPQIGLRVIVAIAIRTLISDAERLAARHDGDAVYRVGARHHESQDGVT